MINDGQTKRRLPTEKVSFLVIVMGLAIQPTLATHYARFVSDSDIFISHWG